MKNVQKVFFKKGRKEEHKYSEDEPVGYSTFGDIGTFDDGTFGDVGTFDDGTFDVGENEVEDYGEEVVFGGEDITEEGGFKHRENYSRWVHDDDEDIAQHETIFGIKLDPETQFKIDVEEILKDNFGLLITDIDKKIIKKCIEKLTFINLKNPTMYVLGYIATKTDDLKFIDTYESRDVFTKHDIIKYKYLWKTILLS